MFLKHLFAERINLALPDHSPEASPFKAKFETADPREERTDRHFGPENTIDASNVLRASSRTSSGAPGHSILVKLACLSHE